MVEPLEWEVGQPGVFGDPDPILAPGPRPVANFQVSQLSADCVRRECRQTVSVDIIKTQLSAWMWAFTTDDDSHPCRPVARVEDSGEFGDVGPVAGVAAGVVGGFPRFQLREFAVENRHRRRQHEPDRIGQAPPGEEVQEVMGAASGVGADEHILTRTSLPAGQASENVFDQSDVVGGGVRSGIAGTQQSGGRFAAAWPSVVDERQQGWNPNPFL